MSEKEYDIKLKATKGYFRSGLPYVRIGNRPHILLIFEGLSFGHNAMFDNSRQFQEDILAFLKESTSEDI